MTRAAANHATFTIEQNYPVRPEEIFAAWSEPAAKASWFSSAGASYALDFRVGGEETLTDTPEGPGWSFTARYLEIREPQLILYTSTMHHRGTLATVSTTTVELLPTAEGTLLKLTEQGAFLSDLEQPQWREKGTADWLQKLRAHLTSASV